MRTAPPNRHPSPLAHPHLKRLYIRWNTALHALACTRPFRRLRWRSDARHFERTRTGRWLDGG